VGRRYERVEAEKKQMPSLVLIDGGLGQLHAAAEALESLEIINQPLAAIAKVAVSLVVAWVFNGMPGERLHQKRARALNNAIYEDLGLAPEGAPK